jgi:hypothetical protein
MGRRSCLDGLKVTVEEGNMLPLYRLEILKELIRKVALPRLADSNFYGILRAHVIYPFKIY